MEHLDSTSINKVRSKHFSKDPHLIWIFLNLKVLTLIADPLKAQALAL
jgi:hypothetical protein